jgi:hypothetical protein
MAMSLRSKTLAAVLGLLVATTAVAEANAGERFQRHRNPGFNHHGIHRVVVRQRVNVRQKVVINIDTRRLRHNGYRVVRGANTYSGAVDVSYRPGVGTWSYGVPVTRTRSVSIGSAVKIIDLNSGKNDCSMEKGVCVIRP